MKLSDKQKEFCKQYLHDLNGAQAAIRAGYSQKTARTIANRLLTKVDIIKYLNGLRKRREVKTQVKQDRVLLEIARLAFADPRRAFDDNGNLLPVKDWPDDVAACIASIKVTEVKDFHKENADITTTLKEIKFWDKSKNLELAARHLGMLNDRLTVRIEDELDGLTREQLLERACRIRDTLMAAESSRQPELGDYIDA